jgi:site-specific DNA-methyltransferase (adenine-specific)
MSSRILQGDCVEIMKNLAPRSVDFILTDPPYLVRYRDRSGRSIRNDDCDAWLNPAFAGMYRALKSDAFCVSFYGWNSIDRFMSAWRKA